MSQANAGQVEFWNGEVGRRWIEQEAAHEGLTAEISARLAAAARPGDQVLDVGCGSGGLSLLLARAVGPRGQVLGLDLSSVLLARAEDRRRADGAANLGFRLADVQDAPLPAGRFDLAVSQFGVMFFADTVAAFANLRGALRNGGRALFAVWGPVGANPWFAIPRAAAADRLGPPAIPPGQGPGPFALSEADRSADLLRRAGFAEVRAVPTAVVLAAPGDGAVTADWMTRTGPASALLREKSGSDADRLAIAGVIAEALRPYETPGGVRVPASILMLSGRAP